MAASTVTSPAGAGPVLQVGEPSAVRVRDRVREGLAVIVFSAAASTGIALCFGLLVGVLGS